MWRLLYLSVNIAITILIIHSPFLTAEPIIGHNMKPASFPFVVSLASKRVKSGADKSHFCMGSLIASNLVLTAAHCLKDETYENVIVLIGPTDSRVSKSKYDVKWWQTFDKWVAKKNPSMFRLPFNDLAVIKLSRGVAGITPVNISTLKTTNLYGKNARLVGWTDGSCGGKEILKQAKVQILSIAECEERLLKLTNVIVHIGKGFICTAADPYTLVKDGDSGGPLLDDSYNLLGINQGFCDQDSFSCSGNLATEQRFNFHVDLIAEFRQFISEMKAHFQSKSITKKPLPTYDTNNNILLETNVE